MSLENPFNQLSDELMLKIFEGCDTADIPRIRMVSREFCRIGSDRTLVENEAQGFLRAIPEMVKHCSNRESVEAKLNAVVADNSRDAPWIMVRLHYLFREALYESSFNTFSNLDQLLPEHDSANLVKRSLCNEVNQVWKRGISQYIQTGFLAIPWGTTFSQRSYRRFLEALSKASEVETLQIAAGMTDEQAKEFGGFLRDNQNTFSTLAIECDPPLSKIALESIMDGLKHNRKLKHLKFVYCPLSKAKFNIIADRLKENTTLKSLKIVGAVNPSDAIQELVPLFQGNGSIEEFAMSRYSNGQLRYLLEKLNDTRLKKLIVRDGEIGESHIELIRGLFSRNTQLELIDLEGSRADDTVREKLEQMRTLGDRVVLPSKVVVVPGTNVRVRFDD